MPRIAASLRAIAWAIALASIAMPFLSAEGGEVAVNAVAVPAPPPASALEAPIAAPSLDPASSAPAASDAAPASTAAAAPLEAAPVANVAAVKPKLVPEVLPTVVVPRRPLKVITSDTSEPAPPAEPQTEAERTVEPALLQARRPIATPAMVETGDIAHAAPIAVAFRAPAILPPPPPVSPAVATPIPARPAPGFATPAATAPTAAPATIPAGANSELALAVNKSQVIHLRRPARDVLVANPAVADVVLRSADTVFVIGRKVGETNVYFFDATGQQIDQLDVRIDFDAGAVEAALQHSIPNEKIDVSTANQSVILNGSVASAITAENARQIARQFVADDKSIINLLKIRGQNQVLLRVRVSEMSRQIVKELGISPNALFNIGSSTLNINSPLQNFINSPFSTLTAATPLGAAGRLTGILQALESNGLVKTLAEPNLTAVSGEPASFLVGGEFPVPAPQSSAGATGTTITVTYKDFGIRLTFTPVVLSPSAISLHISTEVSELSTQGQVQISGFTIPALSVRRAETTVELPSGGTIAIAGLLQNDIQNTVQGLPGLKDIPILGTLFSSTQFQRNESDLVIAVTPLLVKPVDPDTLAFPTDGFGPGSDFDMYLLGRLHAAYSKPAPGQLHGTPKGPFGFIME